MAAKFRTFGVAIWRREMNEYEVSADYVGYETADAAKRQASLILDRWPVSERPEGIARPVIAIRITEI